MATVANPLSFTRWQTSVNDITMLAAVLVRKLAKSQIAILSWLHLDHESLPGDQEQTGHQVYFGLHQDQGAQFKSALGGKWDWNALTTFFRTTLTIVRTCPCESSQAIQTAVTPSYSNMSSKRRFNQELRAWPPPPPQGLPICQGQKPNTGPTPIGIACGFLISVSLAYKLTCWAGVKKKNVTDVERSDFSLQPHFCSRLPHPRFFTQPSTLKAGSQHHIHCVLLSTRMSTYLHFNCENDVTFPKHPGSYESLSSRHTWGNGDQCSGDSMTGRWPSMTWHDVLFKALLNWWPKEK